MYFVVAVMARYYFAHRYTYCFARSLIPVYYGHTWCDVGMVVENACTTTTLHTSKYLYVYLTYSRILGSWENCALLTKVHMYVHTYTLFCFCFLLLLLSFYRFRWNCTASNRRPLASQQKSELPFIVLRESMMSWLGWLQRGLHPLGISFISSAL